jgi:hypothetical protein
LSGFGDNIEVARSSARRQTGNFACNLSESARLMDWTEMRIERVSVARIFWQLRQKMNLFCVWG